MTTTTAPRGVLAIGTTFDSVYAWGRAHGPESMREIWRTANMLRKDDTVSAEARERAAELMSLVERAAAQLKHEATERQQDARLANCPRVGGSSPWAAVRAASAKLPALPHAHYAVEEDGELHFFRVDKPQEGAWVGRTFVKIQASEEYFPIKDPARLVRILGAIAEDPQAAMERYGRKIGRCGHCHRTLTNPESIARGIGPICSERMGW